MQNLASHLSGQWQTGKGSSSVLVNPTTEEPVARADTGGLDLKAALKYAREVGGPALRALTFAQRGALLLAFGKAVHGVREVLIELAVLNCGNTRSDAKFDIDGAIATLMAYADLGATLGDRRVMLDGEPTNIGKSARLQGHHILVPREGVAVHINAFNFPAWGLAEKAACALLAGVPVVSKPATSTALVTWRLVAEVVDKGVLPAGALSLVAGGVGDLLDHLEPADVIAFTGSADTGARIRGHQRVLATGVHVNVEADSLNSAVLAPGATDATYDAFIRAVHTEMTQKAGQKCTATRRILVPRDRLDEVGADIAEKLRGAVVGDPARDDVHVGPLATAGQRKSAEEGIEKLLAEATVVFGDPAKRSEGKGYFVAPLLLQARDAHGAQAVHSVEVFGPVATLIPYDGTAADAAALVRRGEGSLVASIYGDDRAFLESAILALAAWHGRIVVVDEKTADKALAPGLVLPTLLHGGPGRAGGGEELGGLRGLKLYQQRCAIQGNGPLLARILGAPAGA